MESNEYSSEVDVPVSFRWRAVGKISKQFGDLVLRKNGSVNRVLGNLLESRVTASNKPVRGVSTQDIIIDRETGVWVRVFLPSSVSAKENSTTESKLPIVFYFHGGGFALHRANHFLYDAFCRRMCRKLQVMAISVDYRRSPEYRYPIAYEDCFSALKWLQTEGHSHLPSAADPSRCFLMGDSAGGNIAHHVGCMAAGRELQPVRVVGHVLLFPSLGGEERTASEARLADAPLSCLRHRDWYWKAFLPEGESRDHGAANVDTKALWRVALPASMVAVAGHDGLKDRQVRYVEGLKKAGKKAKVVYYAGGMHCFHIFASFKLSPQLLSDIKEFVVEHS